VPIPIRLHSACHRPSCRLFLRSVHMTEDAIDLRAFYRFDGEINVKILICKLISKI
jgi:hypothetical protein